MRHRYNHVILGSCAFETGDMESHKLTVKLQGAVILVFVDEEKKPRIVVEDEFPVEHGCAGIWVKNRCLKIQNFNVIRK